MDNDKYKVLLVLSTPAFAAIYFSSGIVDQISKRFELTLLLDESINLTKYKLPDSVKLIRFKREQKHESHYAISLSVAAWRNRKKSQSFLLRHKRTYRSIWQTILDIYFGYRFQQFIADKNNEKLSLKTFFSKRNLYCAENRPWNFIRSALVAFLMRRMIAILGNKLVFHFFRKFYIARLSIDDSLKNLIAGEYELIIFPNIAFGSLSIEIARIGRELGIKTLYLIDNWDNLSSKSILWELPDYACTWGPQSNEHAIKIHGFRKEQLFNIGTPRYEGYLFPNPDYYATLPNAHNYILFVDGIETVFLPKLFSILQSEMESQPQLYGDAQILFRPHPSKEIRLIDELLNKFPRFALDPVSKMNLSSEEFSKSDYLYSPDYLPFLVKNSRFVIGGFTSMLIEAAIMGKNYLGLAYDVTCHIESPRNLFYTYTHLKDISLLTNLKVCTDLNSLGRDFHNLFTSSLSVDLEALNKTLGAFYIHSTKPYPESLSNLAQLIISKGNHED